MALGPFFTMVVSRHPSQSSAYADCRGGRSLTVVKITTQRDLSLT